MDVNETRIITLFYLAGLVSVTNKQELQTSEISYKAIKHPFNKTLLVFAYVFTVNAHVT